jgi:geranylgeranylglycerol-phosphate geranylgeranyltransferase
MDKLRGYIRLIRPGTTLSGLLATVVGGYVASGGQPNWFRIALAALIVACVQGAGNTLNDVFDQQIDLVNKPWRPLPSGKVSRKEALRLAFSLTIMGVVGSILLGPVNVVIALVVVIALYLYAMFLKRALLVKNLTVAIASALTVIYGAAATGVLSGAVYLLAAIIFVGILAREILKDMADAEGDLLGHAHTIPTVLGIRTAKVAFVVFTVLTLITMLASTAEFTLSYSVVVWIGVIPFLGYAIYRVVRGRQPKDFEQVSGLLKLGFFVWFAAIFLGM